MNTNLDISVQRFVSHWIDQWVCGKSFKFLNVSPFDRRANVEVYKRFRAQSLAESPVVESSVEVRHAELNNDESPLLLAIDISIVSPNLSFNREADRHVRGFRPA